MEHLGELADHLIGHLFDQARKTGASWTEIGRSMGVTKQAAQKRFVARATDTDWQTLLPEAFRAHPFSRFTDRARRAVQAAQDDAREHRHDHICPEHLALGLLAEPEGWPSGPSRHSASRGRPPGRPWSRRCRRPSWTRRSPTRDPVHAAGQEGALEPALREALAVRAQLVFGTEHLLLGLLDDEESLGGSTLTEASALTRERAREWLVPVLEQLAEAKAPRWLADGAGGLGTTAGIGEHRGRRSRGTLPLCTGSESADRVSSMSVSGSGRCIWYRSM